VISKKEARQTIEEWTDVATMTMDSIDAICLIEKIYASIGSCETCKWCHSSEHNLRNLNGDTMHYIDHNCEIRGLHNPDCSRVELTDYCSDYEGK
jgi:hypothetical protein